MTNTLTQNKPFPLHKPETVESDIQALRPYKHDKTRLIREACRLSELSVDAAISPSQLREIAYRRWRVMYVMHGVGWSYAGIGRALSRNHTSILFGCNRVKASLEIYRGETVSELQYWAAE